MPRNSTSTARKTTHAISPLAPPIPPAPVSNSPSLGSIVTQSVASGVGSGVGFSLGTMFTRSLFGPGASQSPSVTVSEYEQCLQANKLSGTETSCYHLSDMYKACMVRTNFNQGQCTRDT